MRVFVILIVMPLLGAAPRLRSCRRPASQIHPAAPMPVQNPYSDERCPETPMSLARKQGERLGPRKLGDCRRPRPSWRSTAASGAVPPP